MQRTEIHLNRGDIEESIIYDQLTLTRYGMLKTQAADYCRRNKDLSNPLLYQACDKLAKSAVMPPNITFAELGLIKLQFTAEDFQIVFTALDQYKKELDINIATLKKVNESNQLSDLQKQLIQDAEYNLIPAIEDTAKTATLGQLRLLTNIINLATRASISPDASNAKAFEKLHNQISGDPNLSFGDRFWIGMKIFWGSLLVATSVACIASMFLICPCFFLPAAIAGICGTFLLHSGVKDLERAKTESKKFAFPEAYRAMHMFNAHLHKRESDPSLEWKAPAPR